MIPRDLLRRSRARRARLRSRLGRLPPLPHATPYARLQLHYHARAQPLRANPRTRAASPRDANKSSPAALDASPLASARASPRTPSSSTAPPCAPARAPNAPLSRDAPPIATVRSPRAPTAPNFSSFAAFAAAPAPARSTVPTTFATSTAPRAPRDRSPSLVRAPTRSTTIYRPTRARRPRRRPRRRVNVALKSTL